MTEDANDSSAYGVLNSDKQAILQNWITETFIPSSRASSSYLPFLTSYGWKHAFEQSVDGFYVTNGEFKGAMIVAGYEPTKDSVKEINWRFKVRLKRELTESEANAV